MTCHAAVGTPFRSKHCLLKILSKASLLPITPSPVYGTPLFLEDSLQLPIFAKRAVYDVEGDGDISRKFKVRPANINFFDDGTRLTQCFRDRNSRAEGNLALRTRSAHENGDSYAGKYF